MFRWLSRAWTRRKGWGEGAGTHEGWWVGNPSGSWAWHGWLCGRRASALRWTCCCQHLLSQQLGKKNKTQELSWKSDKRMASPPSQQWDHWMFFFRIPLFQPFVKYRHLQRATRSIWAAFFWIKLLVAVCCQRIKISFLLPQPLHDLIFFCFGNYPRPLHKKKKKSGVFLATSLLQT